MKLMILDGNSVINRAFYGVRPLTTRDGLYTNAIYGFLNILEKILGTGITDCSCNIRRHIFQRYFFIHMFHNPGSNPSYLPVFHQAVFVKKHLDSLEAALPVCDDVFHIFRRHHTMACEFFPAQQFLKPGSSADQLLIHSVFRFIRHKNRTSSSSVRAVSSSRNS